VHEHEELIEWYRAWLSEKEPLAMYRWAPVHLGPTWERDHDGRFILPALTLGWDVLAWCGTWLQHSRDVPWRFTKEQARFVLWWYALDQEGEFIYHDGTLQRLKGWGKDPLGACLLAVEMLGPCRFDGWDATGAPIARDVAEAWVQTAAVSLEQTKNTMRLLPGLFTAAAKRQFGLQIGKEKVYALGDERLFEAVTSSPATLEGARATFLVLNETHHWNTSNDGHEMAAVISRNAAKSPDGAARTLRITNAYEPGMDSVAERDRTAFEDVSAGKFVATGVLYDSLEAAPEAPLSAEAAPQVVLSIRGDSVWLHPDRIVKEILDPRVPPSEARRFWYNQVTAAEDAWVTPQQWDSCQIDGLELVNGDEIVAFFDGSKSDDATGLVACRISDGAVFTLGVWQRPEHVEEWNVPRADVDGVVDSMFATYDVLGFFADPGLGDDPQDATKHYWDVYIDGWSARYGGDGPSAEGLCLWATTSALRRHAVMWPMGGGSNPNQKLFTEAAERTAEDIGNRAVLHNGHPVMREHVRNARRRPNQWGVTVGKERATRKIDLAVCVIGARMLRRMYLALPEDKQRKHPADWVLL
jgi:hypothetical protein